MDAGASASLYPVSTARAHRSRSSPAANGKLAVKITNTYNEQWNLYTSVGFVRRKYVTTCEPSWF